MRVKGIIQRGAAVQSRYPELLMVLPSVKLMLGWAARIEVEMTLFRIAVLLVLLTVPAAAQEEKKTAIEVVQAELSICLGYYSFVRGCAIEQSDINSASVATANVEKLRKYAYQAGQAVNMSADAMLSRLKLAVEQQQKLLAGDCKNIGKLDEAYGGRCKQLSDNPQAVLDQYLKK